MNIELRKLADIRPYDRNPRVNAAAVEPVARSLREFGARQPIVVDDAGVIVVGHTRYLAALKLGWDTFPVHVATGMTPAQAKAYRIADNATAAIAEWDKELLPKELFDLKELGVDLDVLGFGDAELSRLMSPAEIIEDEVPDPPVEPVTKLGDLWLLGEHRLLCGDSTKAEDVGRVLDGRTPFLMVTDPPYGVELDMEWRDRAGHNQMAPASKSYMKQVIMGGKGISGDTIADWSDAFDLVPSIDIAYVWHATSFLIPVGQGLERIGFELRQQIVWVKTVFAMSRSAYHWKHEPCWYAVRKGKTARWVGGHKETTTWEAASPKHIMSGSKEEKQNHPTQKPVECMARPIRNHGGKDDDVYDPFLGSGTTIIAAEQLNRRCYGIEIAPAYCDVVVARWEKLTNKKAERA